MRKKEKKRERQRETQRDRDTRETDRDTREREREKPTVITWNAVHRWKFSNTELSLYLMARGATDSIRK